MAHPLQIVQKKRLQGRAFGFSDPEKLNLHARAPLYRVESNGKFYWNNTHDSTWVFHWTTAFRQKPHF
jgi:hypothetical protein